MWQAIVETPKQCFREAYLTMKLGRAFDERQAWAQTNLYGVQTAENSSDLRCRFYSRVRICLLAYPLHLTHHAFDM